MKQLLNTLFVMTEGSYLHLEGETVKVKVDGENRLQVPLHHLGGFVLFGNVMTTPFLLHKCAEDGRSVVLLDRNGRYRCRMVGKVGGNVLLRHQQHLSIEDGSKKSAIVRNMVGGKLQNTRQVLMRGQREAKEAEFAAPLQKAADLLGRAIERLPGSDDIEFMRGLEGESAKVYFDCFDRMMTQNREVFRMNGRNRRPPRDRINALLSFLYVLLLNDCISAVEGVGLDPQMGFLHVMRPGRPSLGLDMMEELRPILADRLALTLINLRQIGPDEFDERPGGAVYLNEKGRKAVVTAYQKRKQDEIRHPVLDQTVPFGLIPHVQARLLARHLRGDTEAYTPFLYR
ncbi:type I-C CRISPR-associated endonuclease Cas1c [Trichloromonas sp.]|uniref:type I-C CRISPR-associated endonuclease Cas1c n=1 Tax=Trichloromonas sp. TaxID=3069249 RepID=UPI003D818176